MTRTPVASGKDDVMPDHESTTSKVGDPFDDDPSRLVMIDDESWWRRAADVLDDDGCVVIPTDTVYGLAARADRPEAVARLQRIKGRREDFPPPVMVAEPEDAWGLVDEIPPTAHRLARAFWPGPLTLILATSRAGVGLSELTGSIGLRIPDHVGLRRLLAVTGPLAVSSANRHGQPAATTSGQAISQLGTEVGLYVDGGPTPGPAPSTVVDCRGATPVILRVGLLGAERIMTVSVGRDA
ncbi:MAG: threonylcarbamoyl-AMP synthase [Propionibacteriaceae bacterium]|nr:threonylcarbamoyl-AMP synthase [Propionibacteriaceae bacterium]